MMKAIRRANQGSNPRPATPDRIIRVPRPPLTDHPFAPNSVYTTKYTAANFLPKFLWFQFSKAPNLFFLVISVLQQVPGVSPTSRLSTLIPLSFILAVSGVKEIIEDQKRKKADEKANKSVTRIQREGRFGKDTWSEVLVGDLVQVYRGEPFPADLVFLDSSDPSGICFVETSNIDGETNLKIKESAQTDWRNSRFALTCEPANEQIYSFLGKIVVPEETKVLAISNLLLRGSTLRNTDWVVGVVVYTGPETRIMRNMATATPLKQPRLDVHINQHMSWMLLALLVMVFVSFAWWLAHVLLFGGKRMPHLEWVVWPEFTMSALILRLATYVVLYHSIVPISLLVSMEVCRYHLARLISSDLTFYSGDEPEGVLVSNSNIVDDLGQIEYILSDKTGTLTENRMTLIQAADARGQVYRADEPNGGIPDELAEAMVVCHTVMIEGRSGGSPREMDPTWKVEDSYQASSPDELAIVKGASLCTSYKFVQRQPRSLSISTPAGTHRYDILHLIEFTSERKRMTLVVRRPGSDGVTVLCKGADDVLSARLSQKSVGSHGPVLRAIESFAKSGLRTLAFASREISEQQWDLWCDKYLGSKPSGEDELETDLRLVGVTAVEDCLSPGVPETIETLQAASIKVWILTGDRLETALNVAVSCQLHKPDRQQLILASADALDTLGRGVHRHQDRRQLYDLVVEGSVLDPILASIDLATKFMDLALSCSSVLCCRTSPLQKRLLTEKLQQHSGKLCLAIGDGANDVGMIQAANVGVGIAGKEGRQAARSADVSVRTFSQLARLLLVHGAWSYSRLTKTIVYCAYKNLLLVTSQFWFGLFGCAASGQTVYESWMLTLSNALFTSYLPIVIGVTDQYISADQLLRHPSLYTRGQRNSGFTAPRFWKAALNASLQALGLFLVHAGVMGGDPILADGTAGGMWVFSSTYYCSSLMTLLYKAAIITSSWNIYTVAVLLFGVGSWFGYVLIADALIQSLAITSATLHGITPILFKYRPFWLLVLLSPLIVLLRDFMWKYYKRLYRPRPYHIVQEIEMLARRSRSTADASAGKALMPMGPSPSMSNSSFSKYLKEQPQHQDGFAFSQTEGQATLLR